MCKGCPGLYILRLALFLGQRQRAEYFWIFVQVANAASLPLLYVSLMHNFPARLWSINEFLQFVLAGWRDLWPSHWTLSGMLHATGGWATTDSAMAARRKADLAFLLLIALQWILVGGLPLTRSKRPWGEPGMFITICATLSVAVVFIRPLDDLAKLFAMFAAFAWFWWFGLLVWKFAHSAWKWTARRLATTTI
jgi:hypothetical protein